MLYLFYGPDDYSIRQAIAGLKAKLGDQDMVVLNTTTLDGRRVSVAEIIAACDALPFLAEHRLVIVESLLASWGRGQQDDEEGQGLPPAAGSEASGRFHDYLARLPETTWLVLVEDKVDGRNAIFKLAQQLQTQNRAVVQDFEGLQREELVRWAQERVREAGGRIEAPAARLLVDLVANDLRLLGQEIDKLVAYTDGKRAIGRGDVEALCSYAPESKVFQLTDAVGRRDQRAAFKLLHALLDEGQHPLYLLSMVTRQFRILLSVKDLSHRGYRQEQIASQLRLQSFIVGKALAQAPDFSLAQLECIYERLVEIDVASKTGRMEPDLGLDLFVVDACRR